MPNRAREPRRFGWSSSGILAAAAMAGIVVAAIAIGVKWSNTTHAIGPKNTHTSGERGGASSETVRYERSPGPE
jgi:hypothetical protein